MKLCKDCKYFELHDKVDLSQCHAKYTISLLTGDKIPDNGKIWAEVNRKHSYLCGEDADWFEAKDVSPV